MMFSKFVFDIIDRATYLNCNPNKIKGVALIKDIVYNDNYPDVCTADLHYIPKKEEDKSKYHVIINIHGGGFVAGDKKFRLRFSRQMATTNAFVMNINYGLCPKYKFPDFILHCASSLDWLVANKDKYNLDLDNIMIAGDSAGAYIAAYLGIIQGNEEIRQKLGLPDGLAAKIKALLLYCGPYEVDELLTKKIMLNLQTEIGAAFLNVTKQEVSDIVKLDGHKYRKIININPYINENFPTTFMTFTDSDFLCPGQGMPFFELLTKHGVQVEYHNAKKTRDVHCYHLFWHSKSGQEAIQQTKEFIKKIVGNN